MYQKLGVKLEGFRAEYMLLNNNTNNDNDKYNVYNIYTSIERPNHRRVLDSEKLNFKLY